MNKIKDILDYIYYERSKFITVLIALVIVIPFILFITNNNSKSEEIIYDDLIEEKKEEIKEGVSDNKIFVDIKGEVNNPGLYEIEEGKRIQDVIDMAGGLTDNASTLDINLGSKVSDEMIIIISKKEDVDTPKSSTPSISNTNKSTTTNSNTKTNNGKISINTAGIEELITLNGIKEARAKKIIEYRETNGPFKSIEEIKNVSGIGEGIFAKIKDYITL